MRKGMILQAIKRINWYLTRRERYEAFFNFLLLILASVLDVVGLASIVPVLMAAATPSTITGNKYFAFVFKHLGFKSENSFLLFLIVALFGFFLLKNIFTTWVNYKQVQFTAKIAVKIIRLQFNKYTNLPLWVFNSEGSAKINNAVYSIPQFFINSVIRPIFAFFSEVIIVFIIIFGIFFYQPQLFFVLVIVLFPSAYLTYAYLKNKSERLGKRLNILRPASYMLLLNSFNGFVELKLADKIKMFRDRFVAMQTETQALEARSYLFTLIPVRIIEMVAILGIVTIFLFHLFYNQKGDFITIIGLFAAAAYRIMPSINRILTSLVTIKQFSYCIDELKQFDEYGIEDEAIESSKSIPFKRELRFKNINFSFPQSVRPALKDISFVVKKGEKIGFIGASGSGKTTLMNVLLRFYEQQEGEILIDGAPVDRTNVKSWYSMVGYVKQDTFLMESSIKENITLGDKDVDSFLLDYAIEKSLIKDFINTLPEGINTLIGERGSKLSGGQKQRIGIARALYKNAQVLILDEATSALDNETEKEVSEAISKLSQTDITILIIAHRITTLRDCDRIYELSDGKIIKELQYEDVLRQHL